MGSMDTTDEPFDAELILATVDDTTSTDPTMLDRIDNADVDLDIGSDSH